MLFNGALPLPATADDAEGGGPRTVKMDEHFASMPPPAKPFRSSRAIMALPGFPSLRGSFR